MSELPWGVIIILSLGLLGTIWYIYHILRLAYLETKE